MFNSNTFHTLRFLIIFIALTIFFYGYIGIISPGGKTYSPFFDEYANFPHWLSYFICQCAKGLLQTCGYDVYQRSANNITIRGSHGVTIIWACLGFGVMSFWVAFVSAHKADWKYKVKWIAFGVLSIVALNIARIASIPLAFHYNWKTYTSFDVHTSFNIVSYVAIFGLMFLFIHRYKQYRKIKGNQ